MVCSGNRAGIVEQFTAALKTRIRIPISDDNIAGQRNSITHMAVLFLCKTVSLFWWLKDTRWVVHIWFCGLKVWVHAEKVWYHWQGVCWVIAT